MRKLIWLANELYDPAGLAELVAAIYKRLENLKLQNFSSSLNVANFLSSQPFSAQRYYELGTAFIVEFKQDLTMYGDSLTQPDTLLRLVRNCVAHTQETEKLHEVGMYLIKDPDWRVFIGKTIRLISKYLDD